MKFCGDWDTWIRLASFGNIAFVSSKLNRFRYHQGNTSVRSHMPQAQAERLSCFLSAFSQTTYSTKPLHSSYSLVALILLLLRRHPRRHLFYRALCSISLLKLYHVYICYTKLSRVPSLSIGAWLLITLLNVPSFVIKLLSILVSKPLLLLAYHRGDSAAN